MVFGLLCCQQQLLGASSPQAFEIVAGMMRGARQRARRHHEEALGVSHGLVGLELFRRDEAHHLVMLARRLQILADGQEVDVGCAQVVHQLQHFVAFFAEAHHDARLGEHCGVQFLDPLQQANGVEIARTGTNRQVIARHGFHIVIEDVGLGGDDALQCTRLLQEVRRQDLDRGCRRSGTDRPDHLLKVLGATVFQIITVDRGDDDVAEAHLLDGLGDIFRLRHIERVRLARRDVAEGASTRTDLAHDHEGGVLLVPALADVRAASLFANRDELVLLHDRARLGIALRRRRLHADPVRLAQDFGVRPMRLLRVSNALGFRVDRVENGDHETSTFRRSDAALHRRATLARNIRMHAPMKPVMKKPSRPPGTPTCSATKSPAATTDPAIPRTMLRMMPWRASISLPASQPARPPMMIRPSQPTLSIKPSFQAPSG
ncbi:hypothetical protein RHSP_12697 [Rhizobium freirei PRF 81]|uniref:Uncharacterized protein n=1 Tax=Rhizobium freirei PRF 81 TaxID=363754 RepID=N6UA20_9HYPH|nr:hypothetical protein RHSP_12697 [Rhizobium freirei PRF 81]